MTRILILPLILLFSLMTPVFAGYGEVQAQQHDHYNVPLAVIRFNQPRVYFQRPLANAVQRAIQVSPEVEFKVVHYNPGGELAEKAERDLQSVLKYMYSLGIRPDHVSVMQQAANGLPHDEVHIYVR